MSHKKKKPLVESKTHTRGEAPGKAAWLGLLFAVLAMSGVIGYHLFRHRDEPKTAVVKPSSIATASTQPMVVQQPPINDEAVALYNKGVELAAKEQHEEAIQFFQQAKILAPHDLEVRIMLANSLSSLLKYSDALAELRDGLSQTTHVDPELLVKVHNNMGNFLARMWRREEAIEEYKAAVSINPRYTKAYYGLGLVLEQEGRLDEAIEAYGAVLAINPDDWDTKRAFKAVMARRDDEAARGSTSPPMPYDGGNPPPSP